VTKEKFNGPAVKLRAFRNLGIIENIQVQVQPY